MPPCKSASTASKNVPRRHKTKLQHAQKNAFVLFCGPLCAFCGSFPTTEWLLGTLRSVGLGVMTRVSSYNEVKKKTLSFFTGPPAVPPNWSEGFPPRSRFPRRTQDDFADKTVRLLGNNCAHGMGNIFGPQHSVACFAGGLGGRETRVG